MHYIQDKIHTIIERSSREEFIFDFLGAYDVAKSRLKRLRDSELNKLEEKGELLLRKKVLFRMSDADIYTTLEDMQSTLTYNKSTPRFVIVTDFEKFVALDTKTAERLDVAYAKLDTSYDFFLPLVGIEKQQYQNENPADVKAAVSLAKLFDEISKTNKHETQEQRHALNIFLSRLLFCYFAEDTNIFTSNQFTNSLASHTLADGSDTHLFLEQVFETFNHKDTDTSRAVYLQEFPYVNGKLFQDTYAIPTFTSTSRKLLIELGEQDRKDINPDIFGSMMQAVMNETERSNMGSHYTSVPNIMKVIRPLFLDELEEAFVACGGQVAKLRALLTRISKIKFFDPACGSGNFLIIAYKEIRRLEIRILKQVGVGGLTSQSEISLSQFYGIELNDFAHETAKLSLYLAEHQMNVEFEREVGITTVSLPLRLGGHIVCGNATRVDWEKVCPKASGDEIYIMGNPPYLGFKKQNKEQKIDMTYVFDKRRNYKKLDYIACRFYKGAMYIEDINAQYAFVSTNSICQGEQVLLLWKRILGKGLEIDFAYQSFKWRNNAKSNAAVIVIIVGLRNCSDNQKYIYKSELKQPANNINPYLVDGKNVFIAKLPSPLSDFPKMQLGDMAKDGGYLFLNKEEKELFVNTYPDCKGYIKEIYGAKEFLSGHKKWCLWINDNDIQKALKIPFISDRLDKVSISRKESAKIDTQNFSKLPHRFVERRFQKKPKIIVPTVSSSRRDYIPIGFLKEDHVINAPNNMIHTFDMYIFGVIHSAMHVLWVSSVGGKLKNDYRYSTQLCYNTFPFPAITKKQKAEIEEYVYGVLDERERHSEKTLAQMYDPDKMPEGLREAHHQLDLAIERCYRPRPFTSDEERLEYLFKLYERMIAKEEGEKSI